jgi:beta-lactamase regulating signal transducer with metallopeptidase domain
MRFLVEVAIGNAIVAAGLAIVVFALTRVARKPVLCHCLWVLVLAKLLMPPIVSLPVPLTTALAPHFADGLAATPAGLDAAPPAPRSTGPQVAAPTSSVLAYAPSSPRGLPSRVGGGTAIDFVPFLLVVWLSGTAWVSGVTARRIWRFHRLLRLTDAAPAWLQQETEALAGRIGLRRCPRVCVVPSRTSPMLWALTGPPRLLFPERLLESLSAEGRRTLIVHELAHLRRRDHWVRVVEIVATACYWWHPVVWWARREIRRVEEECCDGWVVSEMPAARRTYAEALIAAIQFLSKSRPALPPGAMGVGHFGRLKRRVTMVMVANQPESLSHPNRFAVALWAGICLPLLPTLTPFGQEGNRLESMRRRAEATAVYRLDAPTRSAVRPLLRYSDVSHGIVEGTLWAYGAAGRPLALQKVEYYRLPGKPEWFYALGSFSEERIGADWPNGMHWAATQPGLVLSPLPNAPQAAKRESGRLLQMREIAERFSALQIDQDAGEEMSLLEGPVVRYADSDSGLQDGAIFAFASPRENNPNLMLLVELHGADRLHAVWKYSLVRMTLARLVVVLDGKPLWSVRYLPQAQADVPSQFDAWLFFHEPTPRPDGAAARPAGPPAPGAS